jgi:16S rRNA (guanine527-N7)-methyltransferase
LVGPREAENLFTRHYAEALAALPLLPEGPARLLDLGSGAGFPGIVLAAARPDWQVILVEPRARKWAFLSAVVRRAALSCLCLDARVTANELPELPGRIDVVTARALRLEPAAFENLASKLAPNGRLLLWTGQEAPELPPRFVPDRRLALAGSAHRLLREYRQRPPT